MNKVVYTEKANEDISAIIRFLLSTTTVTIANRIVQRIYAEVQKFNDNPLLNGYSIEDLSGRFRRWTVVNGLYQIYFVKMEDIGMLVVRVWPSKRQPLTADEIASD